jgi:pimeloyl-ACP methyl ester carboxylesterase
MVDTGSGPPLVLVPGIQGRWEWMRPAVDALAARCRVLSSSLAGDPGSGAAIDAALGFDSLVAQIDGMRERAGLDRVALCGVSFGGLVAVRYAALRPEHTAALVVVSTPGPRWRPDARIGRYVRHPVAMAPLFAAGAPRRLGREIRTARDGWWSSVRFAARHTARVLASPMSPTRMSQRVRLAGEVDFEAACARVRAPTLVVTGEPELDRVVRAGSTREYAALIAGARAVTFERTGHIGLVTRPERFAEIVGSFVDEAIRIEARAVRLEA